MRIARAVCCSGVLASVVTFSPRGGVAAVAAPAVRDILARYQRAVGEPSANEITQLETYGTISGAGLSGEFHTWRDGERERTDQNLGPRSEHILRLGDRVWFSDADGNVREYTGLLARRSRTDRIIDSGAFAKEPERCAYRGRSIVMGKVVDALDVTADAGETETLYLDAATGLIDRIAFEDDDGRSTIDLSDWRSVEG
ncbi:MAG: hypothetical protein IAI50_20455, partial [Candidatus Eremiobacteraeota bacterium]|nr:hypothetical protein [Candidatus Eremiobacteraeota bacterium]